MSYRPPAFQSLGQSVTCDLGDCYCKLLFFLPPGGPSTPPFEPHHELTAAGGGGPHTGGGPFAEAGRVW